MHQTSCVNTKKKIAVESKHGHILNVARHILNVARALMIQSHLPKIY